MSFHNQLKSKIVGLDEVSRYVNSLRLTGKKVVFTNGCFDILHTGHVEYLTQARDLGGILVVGLNTDTSVKMQNKGNDRPINNENNRANVLAALACVDVITFFNEETPLELIKNVQPDVLVKGGDYIPEKIVGYDVVKARGGEVLTIPFVEGYSTTSLVQKLKG
ncbi:MAG: D-glycero-beta-D-manno-heptose 1-phosphate adenylyltransferase [Bacteroidia bacterium]|nr:D-glycero-beta-D-manno-heptose 1-phosphate adenylyltransferase [Bacteroidia bacterium]